jgi:hypothetical protein
MNRVLIALVLSIPLALGLSLQHGGATHERVGAYGPFAGSWYRHGFTLEVTAGGSVFAVYRLYAWCNAQQRFGCDRSTGNQIYDGGLWAASLQKPNGATVTGVIVASADSSLDGTTIRLVRPAHDIMLLTWGAAGHRMQTTLCGPKARLAACGA